MRVCACAVHACVRDLEHTCMHACVHACVCVCVHVFVIKCLHKCRYIVYIINLFACFNSAMYNSILRALCFKSVLELMDLFLYCADFVNKPDLT